MKTADVVVFEESYQIRAARESVWEALTDPSKLERWFAERVRVEARVGGAFEFWGKHTAWVERREDAGQRITRFDAPSRLAFTWPWRGTACDVDLRLEERGDAATLRVRMEAGAGGDLGEYSRFLMLDFWKLSVGNLRTFLATGNPALRPDFTDRSGDVRLAVIIRATPKRVWATLTDPNEMQNWIAKAATVAPLLGGAYSYGWEIPTKDGGTEPCGPSRVVEIVPERLLVTDWTHGPEKPTRVRWELTPVPEGTRVTLSHNVVPDEPTRSGYVGGWSGFLAALSHYAADGVASTPEL